MVMVDSFSRLRQSVKNLLHEFAVVSSSAPRTVGEIVSIVVVAVGEAVDAGDGIRVGTCVEHLVACRCWC